MLTRSGLTYLEFSSEVFHDSFCQLGNSVSLSWVVCHEAFCLHVVSSSSCIPAVYLEPVLFLICLQCVNLFCNLSKCILLFFSYISSLLLLFVSHSADIKCITLNFISGTEERSSSSYCFGPSECRYSLQSESLEMWIDLSQSYHQHRKTPTADIQTYRHAQEELKVTHPATE